MREEEEEEETAAAGRSVSVPRENLTPTKGRVTFLFGYRIDLISMSGCMAANPPQRDSQ